MIDTIILDFDGVMVTGTNEGYPYSNKLAIKTLLDQWKTVKAKQEYDEELIHSLTMENWGTAANVVFTEVFLPTFFEGYTKKQEKEGLNLFNTTLKEYYLNNARAIKNLRGFVEEVLTSYKRAIVSATDSNIVKGILKQERINQLFPVIVSGYRIKDRRLHKPHPYMLKKALALLDSRPEKSLYIGDVKSDVEMAQAAGVIPIIVLSGNLDKKKAKALVSKANIIEDLTKLEPDKY